MNVFEAYADRARIITNAPPPMLGPIKTRAEARVHYAEMVKELQGLSTAEDLRSWLVSNRQQIAQYASALEFMWTGNADFRGLKKEIEWATARVDAGLDFPRWEPDHPSSVSGLGD